MQKTSDLTAAYAAGPTSHGPREPHEPLFSIKQVADLFGVTRGAIRFYQDKGLVNPYTDKNGFRWYSLDDIFQLIYLHRYSSMSLELGDVARFLRRESSTEVDQLLDILDHRSDQLQREIKEKQGQLEALAIYRSTLADIGAETIHIEDAPQYWEIERTQLSQLMQTDPVLLSKLVGLGPRVIVGGMFNLADLMDSNDIAKDAMRSVLCLPADAAIEAGLQQPTGFTVLPACRVAERIVRCSADNKEQDLLKGALHLVDDLLKQGYSPLKPPGKVFAYLLLVHQEDSCTVEYGKLFIPLTAAAC